MKLILASHRGPSETWPTYEFLSPRQSRGSILWQTRELSPADWDPNHDATEKILSMGSSMRLGRVVGMSNIIAKNYCCGHPPPSAL